MNAKIVAMLIVFMLVVPVTATVQYPGEYYTLGTSVDSRLSAYESTGYADLTYQIAQLKELRRQTILLERQNELLQEQVDLLKKIAPREKIPEGNYTFFYGGVGVKDPRYIEFTCTDAWCRETNVNGWNNLSVEYCNALNTSQCWRNWSDVPEYSTGEHQQKEGGVSEV